MARSLPETNEFLGDTSKFEVRVTERGLTVWEGKWERGHATPPDFRRYDLQPPGTEMEVTLKKAFFGELELKVTARGQTQWSGRWKKKTVIGAIPVEEGQDVTREFNTRGSLPGPASGGGDQTVGEPSARSFMTAPPPD